MTTFQVFCPSLWELSFFWFFLTRGSILFVRAYDVKPSQNDLVDHMDLIAEAVKRDDVNLAKSKVCFLE